MEHKIKIRQIEARLRKKAAELWDIPEEELKDFDPLVNLLIGACASEFARIYNVLDDADAVVLQRLAEITLPEVLIGPKPAHTILHVLPSGNNVTLKRNKSRIYVPNHTANNTQEPQDYYFSPIHDFKLFNGFIKRMAVGNALYDVENPKEREILLQTESIPIPHGHIWFGLEIGERISSENLPFYFQPKEDNSDFLALLPMARWYDDTQQLINTQEGLPFKLESKFLNEAFKDIHQLEEDALNFYEQHYITLKPDGVEEKKSSYPEVFKTYFNDSELFSLNGEFAWIKVEFSTALKPQVFEELQVAINAVPVVNRHLEGFPANVVKGINVVPLFSERNFLAMESVTNDYSIPYEAIDAATLQAQKKGSYALRRGRMSKMDKREAYEMLNYLTDLVRDERMAFKALDRIELSKGLKIVEDWLKKFLDAAQDPGESPTFLIAHPLDKDDRIHYRFWTTMGEAANTIRSNAKISLETGDDIHTDALLFLRDVKGGRNRPKLHHQLNIFKSAFLSRGRMVTVEDIKAQCFELMGTWIKKVTVATGYKAGEGPNQGILKVIQVAIYPTEEWANDPLMDQVFWQQRLQRILESKSSGFQPFEVVIRLPQGQLENK